MRFIVIHGPNLNLLGTREPEVYGTATLEEIDSAIRAEAGTLGVEVDIHQTQREGEIIELLHGGIDACDGAVLNPGAYTHTSRAIADAVKAVPFPVVEVHVSNIHAREEWRSVSVTAQGAAGIISGFGATGYVLGLRALKELMGE